MTKAEARDIARRAIAAAGCPWPVKILTYGPRRGLLISGRSVTKYLHTTSNVTARRISLWIHPDAPANLVAWVAGHEVAHLMDPNLFSGPRGKHAREVFADTKGAEIAKKLGYDPVSAARDHFQRAATTWGSVDAFDAGSVRHHYPTTAERLKAVEEGAKS